jgi:hypothetical protein
MGLFAWKPGKASWPRQQPQAHNFVGLGGDRCLEPQLPAKAASKQTYMPCYHPANHLFMSSTDFLGLIAYVCESHTTKFPQLKYMSYQSF